MHCNFLKSKLIWKKNNIFENKICIKEVRLCIQRYNKCKQLEHYINL